jgi:hypothetical protein
MQLIALLTSLCKALALYFELKNKSFYYDIEEKHQARKKKIIDEINQNRNAGRNNNTNIADQLLSDLELEIARFKHISTHYHNASTGNTSTDSGRPLSGSN